MAISTTGLIANIYANGEVTGGVTETTNAWQQYTYNFTATETSTQVSFLFRQDPAYWFFDDVSVKASGSSTNLVSNPGFEGGSIASDANQPVDWSLIGTPGLSAAGVLSASGAHTGTGDWYDGAVNGFDGLAQTITTVPDTIYTLSFWLKTTSTLQGTQAPSTSPDSSSSVEQFLVYAGALPDGLTVTPPTPPPSAPTVTAIDGSTTATTDANNRPVITGLASSSTPTGSTVTVFADGTQIGTTTTMDSAGHWTFTPTTALAVGSHSITATETVTGAGTSTQSDSYTVSIITAPVVIGSDGVGNHTDHNSRPAISGIAAASTPTGTPVTVYADGTQLGTTTTTDTAGHWSFTPTNPLATGSHSITARETVGAVQSNLSAPYALDIEPVPPPAALTLAPVSDTGTLGDDRTRVTTPAVTGTGTAGDTVTLYDGAAAVGGAVVGEDGTWSVTTTALAEGAHTLTAKDTDGAGNVSPPSAPLVVTIDTTASAPAALTLAPASDTGTLGDDRTRVTTPEITGTGTAGDTVTLYDGAAAIGGAVVGEDGTWSVTTTALAEGARTLTATDTDGAGNVSPPSAPLVVTIDAIAPAPPTLGASLMTTNPARPEIAGTAEPLSQVRLWRNGENIGTVTAADGTWNFNHATALTAGSYTLNATATDTAGNVSAPSDELVLTVDADGSYAVVTPVAGTGTIKSYIHDPNGVLSTVRTNDTAGNLLVSVTDGAALINIHDTAGTLIGTIAQPSTSAFGQPVFATTPLTLAASTESGPIGSVVNLFAETNNLVSQGNDTITVHAGTAVITATGPSTVVRNIGANVTFYGSETGTASFFGGDGTTVAIGGGRGGTLIGGTAGGNVLVAGGGVTTLVGAADGDRLFGSDTGIDTIFGGAGNETLIGGGGTETLVATGGDVAFGGSGHSTLFAGGGGDSVLVADGGDVSLWGGSGASTLWGGSGHDVLGGNAEINSETLMVGGTGDAVFIGSGGTATAHGGSGDNTFWVGAGAMAIHRGGGNDTVVFGAGDATVDGGTAAAIYVLINGRAGGTDIISDFKVGLDRINCYGFDNQLVEQRVNGGSTVLSFADHTSVVLVGVTQLASNSLTLS